MTLQRVAKHKDVRLTTALQSLKGRVLRLIPEDCIPRSTLECLYQNAEALLNEPGAIMQAASSDPRIMTVKSRHGKVPLLVKPLKNENQFECNCTTYKSLRVCQDTIAVANNLDCLKKCLVGLRKKLQRKRGKKGVNVSAAYNSRRKPSEQGLKAHEISKVCRRKRSEVLESWKPTETIIGTTNTHATTSAMPASYTGHVVNCEIPEHQAHHPQLQIQPQQQLQYQQQFQQQSQRQQQPRQQSLLHQQPYQLPQQPQEQLDRRPQYFQPSQQRQLYDQQQQPQQEQRIQLLQPDRQGSQVNGWHSGMSPYRYEVCIMQNNIKKCYGCNHEFVDTYRCHPQNVIIRHVDKRIRGLTNDGSILYGADFAKTYYHCKFSHISMKNPYFDRIVYLNPQLLLSAEQQCVLMSGNLTVKYISQTENIWIDMIIAA